ncbi:MAG: cysteine-rich CWC family protein [Planctomycetes bacterium]|nr:cysteine-rich CWC family protein [Planctomycetota bacterium]
MSDVDPARCPLCGQPNQCVMATADDAGRECWCAAARIAATVLDSIPADALGQACLCARCADDLGFRRSGGYATDRCGSRPCP